MLDVSAFYKDKDFIAGYWKGKPRPTSADEELKKLAVNELLPQVLKWQKDYEKEEIPKIAEELVDVIEESADGFKICRDLENNYHWACDSELVEIFDNFSFWEYRKASSNAWIRDNEIKPKFKVGMEVKIPKRKRVNKGIETGIIKKVREDEGVYIVDTQWGEEKSNGTYGLIIYWEELEKENECT
jgi:hypothetical protein